MTSQEIFNELVCNINSAYGAPMGRRDNMYPPIGVCSITGLPILSARPIDWKETPYFDRRVKMSCNGVYDKGGAYWGHDRLRVRYSKCGQFWEFYEF